MFIWKPQTFVFHEVANFMLLPSELFLLLCKFFDKQANIYKKLPSLHALFVRVYK